MSTTVTATSTAKRRRLTRDLPSLSIVASDASIRAHTPSVSSASVTSSFRPAELEGRLNRWTRYRSFCSARCIDIAQGLTKRKGQGSSSLLFYFKDFPCRRAEVVGLVVGVRINSMDVIIYEIDDGTEVLECKCPLQKPSSPSKDVKGKRKADAAEDEPIKEGFGFNNLFTAGTVVRVLGEIREDDWGRKQECYIFIETVERCSRLTDEPRHAKKARQLRETLYVDFDLTLALHQAGRLNDVRPAKDTEWTSRKAPSSPQMPRSSQRSYRELSSELDLDYLIPAAATPLPLAPFSQRSRASSDVDESYTSVLGNSTFLSNASNTARRGKLQKPEKLTRDQLLKHKGTLCQYVLDHIRRHSKESITLTSLLEHRHLGALARRIAEAKGIAGPPSMAARRLFVEALHHLRNDMEIAPSARRGGKNEDLDAYEAVTVELLEQPLLRLLSTRSRTPTQLAAALRTSEERWTWARQHAIMDILESMVNRGSVRRSGAGLYTVVA